MLQQLQVFFGTLAAQAPDAATLQDVAEEEDLDLDDEAQPEFPRCAWEEQQLKIHRWLDSQKELQIIPMVVESSSCILGWAIEYVLHP